LRRYTFNFIETPILPIFFIREINNITSILSQEGNFISDI